MELMLVTPPWLEQLLSTTFFSACKTHIKAPRNECNMYCLECRESFCYCCRQAWHNDHQVIQIRRSSYHDVVRVAEIQKVLDISGVQTYVINSARVIFLNERPQNQIKTSNAAISGSKPNSHLCEICKRYLLDPFRFCSLGCKLVGIKKNGNASFVLSAKKDEEIGNMDQGMSRRLLSKQEDEEILSSMREGIQKQVYKSTFSPYCSNNSSQQACSNSRRRKGIPHRAPLGP
ncbi:protein RGF1 INDUCIBLE TRANSCRIPTION FACTOR [Trifolium repens]|nr:protein RGF1 INDUCIBLE TRANSCRIPTION FACTOR [Trifolium repens]